MCEMSENNRKSLRLKGYDYSKCGAYFVTICTRNRAEILGTLNILNQSYDADTIVVHDLCRGDPCGRPYVDISELGRIAIETIDTIESMFPCQIVEYIIMPDHIHLVLFLNIVRTTARVAPTEDIHKSKVTLGRVVGAYKSIIANNQRKQCGMDDQQMGNIWQRGYYEHIIRSPDELCQIRKYIKENPIRKYYDYLRNLKKI